MTTASRPNSTAASPHVDRASRDPRELREASRTIVCMCEPRGRPDGDEVDRFWRRFLALGVVDRSTPSPAGVGSFGDSAAMADELIALVICGSKRATASALSDYESDGDPPPLVGALSIATDGSGRPRAVLHTVDVRIGPLSSVDDSFAWDEGEGLRTRDSWLADHEAFFRRQRAEFDPEMATVFERFEVLYTE